MVAVGVADEVSDGVVVVGGVVGAGGVVVVGGVAGAGAVAVVVGVGVGVWVGVVVVVVGGAEVTLFPFRARAFNGAGGFKETD